MRYQIQEMLRIEKVFEEAGIQDELDAYNPLVPDGRNLKATMLVEYEDPEARKAALARLIGIEDRVWIEVEGCARVYAIADEDLPRENDVKTSAVHFLRFELTPEMASALRRGAGLAIGVDHPAYAAVMPGLDPTTLRGPRRRHLVRGVRAGQRGGSAWTLRVQDARVASCHASRRIDQTRNSSGGPPRCARNSLPTSIIPHFASTRPDAGLRARWIAPSVSMSTCANASATTPRAAAVA